MAAARAKLERAALSRAAQMADLESGLPGRRCPTAGGTVPKAGTADYCLVKAARTGVSYRLCK